MGQQNENILSGRDLKGLMIGGKLPDEYINEKNIRKLLQYELEEMGDEKNYETEIMKYCFEVLRENYRPADYEARKQRTYKNIKKKTDYFYKSKKSLKKKASSFYIPKRIAAIASIVLAVLVSFNFVVVQAFGINLFEVVLKWGEEQLSIIIKNDNSALNETPNENLYIEFQSFDEFIKSSPDLVLPTYLPNEFDFQYAEKRIDDTYIEYNVVFRNSLLEKQILYSIQEFTNTTEEKEYKVEIDKGYNEEYSYNDVIHYITSNYENYNVVWSYKNCVYNMSTSISLDEIKLIINSFYGGNN